MDDPVRVADPGLREPNLLFDLGKSFSAVLDLSEVLTRVVDAAVMLTGADEGLIILQNPETASLSLEAIRVAGTSNATAVKMRADDSLASYVLSKVEPILLSPGDDLPIDEPHAKSDRAIIYVPLITKGRPIGVLGVTNLDRVHVFSQPDQDRLSGLAGYAAIAIENARLYMQAVTRSLELSLLVESANALSWSFDLGRVLTAITRNMMRSLEAHWCIIYDWKSETRSLVELAEQRLAIWPPAGGPHLDLKQIEIYRDCLADGDPRAAYENHPWLQKNNASRLLAIPLQTEGRIIGLVEVLNHSSSEDFSPAQITQSLRFSLDIGTALDRYQSLYGRQQMLEATRNLAGSSGGDWISVYTWDRADDILIRVLDYGTALWVDKPAPVIQVRDMPTLEVVLQEQRTATIRSSDKTISAHEAELFQRPEQGAVLFLPLVFKARTVGLVQLLDISPSRDFSEREMGLAQALANQAAVALENAHLVSHLAHSLQEQKAMQAHLVRAARFSALGELSAVIAHQINNPLTTILGDAEILAQDIPPDHPNHESAEAIQRAGRRAKRVVERMLSMARSEVEPVPTDLAQTIKDTIELVGAQIEQQGTAFTVDVQSPLPQVMAIPGQLEDVWMNLLLNARDAVSRDRAIPGQIALRVRTKDNESVVQVIVEDNGVGISEEHLSKVYDPMFTTKPSGRGTGLGLYICRQIIQDHNGMINIESAVGKGTTITVELPSITSGEA